MLQYMVYGFWKKARYKRSMCPPLPPTVQPVVYNFVDARKDDKTNSTPSGIIYRYSAG